MRASDKWDSRRGVTRCVWTSGKEIVIGRWREERLRTLSSSYSITDRKLVEAERWRENFQELEMRNTRRSSVLYPCGPMQIDV